MQHPLLCLLIHDPPPHLRCGSSSKKSTLTCMLLTGIMSVFVLRYAFVWLSMLYHFLVCKFIPMSGFQVYTYFCYIVLYLLLLWLLLLFPNLISDLLYLFLVCSFILTSVISNSGLFHFTDYAIVRYIIVCAPHQT